MMNATQVSELRVMVILWVALASSVLMYGAVAVVLTSGGESPPFEEAMQSPVVGMLHFVGLGILAVSWILPDRLLRATADRVAPTEPRAPGAPLHIAPAVRVACMVQWALIEAPAVIGLVLAFLTMQPLLFAPLGALSIMGFVFTFPSEDRLRRLVEKANKA